MEYITTSTIDVMSENGQKAPTKEATKYTVQLSSDRMDKIKVKDFRRAARGDFDGIVHVIAWFLFDPLRNVYYDRETAIDIVDEWDMKSLGDTFQKILQSADEQAVPKA